MLVVGISVAKGARMVTLVTIFTVTLISEVGNISNLNHMLVVGVPVSQGALGEDGDVGEHVEESQPGPHVCRRTQVVGAEREVRPKYNFNNFNLLKTTMNVRRRPTAM